MLRTSVWRYFILTNYMCILSSFALIYVHKPNLISVRLFIYTYQQHTGIGVVLFFLIKGGNDGILSLSCPLMLKAGLSNHKKNHSNNLWLGFTIFWDNHNVSLWTAPMSKHNISICKWDCIWSLRSCKVQKKNSYFYQNPLNFATRPQRIQLPIYAHACFVLYNQGSYNYQTFHNTFSCKS